LCERAADFPRSRLVYTSDPRSMTPDLISESRLVTTAVKAWTSFSSCTRLAKGTPWHASWARSGYPLPMYWQTFRYRLPSWTRRAVSHLLRVVLRNLYLNVSHDPVIRKNCYIARSRSNMISTRIVWVLIKRKSPVDMLRTLARNGAFDGQDFTNSPHVHRLHVDM